MNNKRGFILTSLLVSAILWLSAFPCHAELTTPSPNEFLIRWVDAHGKIYGRPYVEKAEWVWSKSPLGAKDSPALRVWVHTAKPAELLFSESKIPETSGPGVSVVSVDWKSEVQTLVLDLRSSKGTVQLTLKDKQQSDVELTLFLQVTPKTTAAIVHPLCDKYDINIVQVKNDARHLYDGISCVETADAYDIYFFRSLDSTWDHNDISVVQFDKRNRFTQFKFHMPRPSEANVYSAQLFRAGTVDEAGKSTVFAVMYAPKITPKKFYSSAGIGVSFYDYKETAESLNLHQVSLTPKINVGYRLVPKILDVAINAFGNAVDLYHTPSSQPAARWIGVNGRLGYRLPVGLGATEFMLLTGLYIWTMIVPGDAYGVKNLSGPQIFLMMNNAQSGHHPFWLYLKYALMNESATQISSLANHEVSIGGGYGLSTTDPKPYSLTIDIAQVSFGINNATTNNSLSLLSITGGVQKAF